MLPKRIGPATPSRDPFDLWLKQAIQKRWGGDPASEDVPQDLLRLACDTHSEWQEMKDRWTAQQERRDRSLD